ncbi:MAG: undecaprenyl-diphosphate phosphatase [Planctomycetota bacterium]
MDWWQAIVLGVVEGLTEYLPVSSTGHLILAQRAMGLTGEAANAYAICIQAGAILAVLGLYRKRVKQVSAGWLGKAGLGSGDEVGFKLGLNMLIAFMPAAVVGLLLNDWIKANLFGLRPVVWAWLVGGVAILATAWWRKRREQESGKGRGLEDMTWVMALGIGMIQCAAMWPGTSRSLVTIVGGVLLGLSLAAAVEFSFLLGVVTLLAATVYESIDKGPVMLEAYGWGTMLIGSLAAWASAVVAVTWMVSFLKKHGMEIFGYYRIGLAVVVGGLLLGGVLSAG